MIVRGSQGLMVEGMGGMLKAESALMAEATACRESLKVVVKKEFAEVEVETD